MDLNIIKRYLSCNHRVTFCATAAAASYYKIRQCRHNVYGFMVLVVVC